MRTAFTDPLGVPHPIAGFNPAAPPEPEAPGREEIVASLSPEGAAPLLDVAFSHKISLIANALSTPPPGLVARGHDAGVVVAAPLPSSPAGAS